MLKPFMKAPAAGEMLMLSAMEEVGTVEMPVFVKITEVAAVRRSTSFTHRPPAALASGGWGN